MQQYHHDEEAVALFLCRLHEKVCPFCGAQGTQVRHGYIYGAVAPDEYGIRAWRIFCDPESPHGVGCGRAPSIRLSRYLRRRCFTAEALWEFIQALASGVSVYAAAKSSGLGCTLRTVYRLHKRLDLCQSLWRTCLCSRSPPPSKERAGSPLLQAFAHLQEVFKGPCAVTQYQETFQRDFLGLA